MIILASVLAPEFQVCAADAAATTSTSYNQQKDVLYGEIFGVGLLMDVFTPREKANGLAIIDVASGAWHSDRNKIRDHTLAQLYQIHCSHGYTVFAVRPGSRTRFTALEMSQNIKTAIRYVKAHATEYKIDPTRIGLTGHSAGGHLSLLTLLTSEPGKSDANDPLQRLDTSVKAVAVFFPPADFLDWKGDGKIADAEVLGGLLSPGGVQNRSEDDVREMARKISPLRLAKKVDVPILIFHGDADPLVPLDQSKRFVEAMKTAGNSIELIVKAGGGHPWLTIPDEVKVMADWFDRQLGAASTAK